jgi:hypothetical protein
MTLRAAFTLAFAAFLRIGEIYSAHDLQAPQVLDFGRWFVTKRSVVIAEDGSALEISLPASKTDPFRKSVTPLSPLSPLSLALSPLSLPSRLDFLDLS